MRSVLLPKPLQLPSKKNEEAPRSMLSLVGTPQAVSSSVPTTTSATITKGVSPSAWQKPTTTQSTFLMDPKAPQSMKSPLWADEAGEMNFEVPLPKPAVSGMSASQLEEGEGRVKSLRDLMEEALVKRKEQEVRMEDERKARLRAKLVELERLDMEQRKAEVARRQHQARTTQQALKQQEQAEQSRLRQQVEKSREKKKQNTVAPAKVVQMQPVPTQVAPAWQTTTGADVAPALPGQWPEPVPAEEARKLDEEQKRLEAYSFLVPMSRIVAPLSSPKLGNLQGFTCLSGCGSTTHKVGGGGG